VACCFLVVAAWWRFFCRREVRLERRASGAVVSIRGSESGNDLRMSFSLGMVSANCCVYIFGRWMKEGDCLMI